MDYLKYIYDVKRKNSLFVSFSLAGRSDRIKRNQIALIERESLPRRGKERKRRNKGKIESISRIVKIAQTYIGGEVSCESARAVTKNSNKAKLIWNIGNGNGA